MISISALLKKSGHEIYLNSIGVMGVSVLWSLLIVPAIFIIPVPFSFVVLLFILPGATSAAFKVMNQAVERQKMIVRHFFAYFAHFYGRSLIIGLVNGIAVLIPVSTWWYYLESGGYLLFIFSVFQTYLCGTFLASQVYAIPFLVRDDISAIEAMNRSIKAFLKKPFYAIGLFIQAVSVTVLLSLTIVGLILLYIGIMAVFILNASKNINMEFAQPGGNK